MLPAVLDNTELCPCAITSGLTRKSKLGPIELKDAYDRSALTAPIANTLFASAGTPIWGSALFAEFPALATTTIPLLNAIFAPLEANAVFPVICE